MRTKAEDGPSLSFLDVVACAFGAIVLLVLILPIGEFGVLAEAEPQNVDYSQYINANRALDEDIRQLTRQIQENEQILQDLNAARSTASDRISKSRSAIVAMQKQLETQTQETSAVEAQYQQVMANNQERSRLRKVDYAGIPVDAEYVAIVLDTSSSMQSIWPIVVKEVTGVLSIYPELKGFQILSDIGEYLFETSRGRWVRDTPARRVDALTRLRTWKTPSRSSPAKGIKTAISDLYKQNETMALFVFGDDFSESVDLDEYVRDIDSIVGQANVKEGSLRIHAIGFRNPFMVYSSLRFSVLMHELTKRHSGAFLALPRRR